MVRAAPIEYLRTTTRLRAECRAGGFAPRHLCRIVEGCNAGAAMEWRNAITT